MSLAAASLWAAGLWPAALAPGLAAGSSRACGADSPRGSLLACKPHGQGAGSVPSLGINPGGPTLGLSSVCPRILVPSLSCRCRGLVPGTEEPWRESPLRPGALGYERCGRVEQGPRCLARGRSAALAGLPSQLPLGGGGEVTWNQGLYSGVEKWGAPSPGSWVVSSSLQSASRTWGHLPVPGHAGACPSAIVPGA